MNTLNNTVVIPIDDVVLFPKTKILIYVSDAKTIQVFQEHILHNKEIAICMSESNGFNVHHLTPEMTGCMAKATIREVDTSGSAYIGLEVTERIQLIQLIQNIPHFIYSYKVIPDFTNDRSHNFDGGQINRLKNKLLCWSEEVIDNSLDREEFQRGLKSLEVIVNYSCMHLIKAFHMRQSLLENRSLSERIHILNLLLNSDEYHGGANKIIEKAFEDFRDIERNCLMAH